MIPTNHVAATVAPGTVLRFKYTNYQMETEWRRARVGGMPWFGSSEFHTGSQWFLPAFCLDRKATRQFAMRDMAEVSVEFVKESKNAPDT